MDSFCRCCQDEGENCCLATSWQTMLCAILWYSESPPLCLSTPGLRLPGGSEIWIFWLFSSSNTPFYSHNTLFSRLSFCSNESLFPPQRPAISASARSPFPLRQLDQLRHQPTVAAILAIAFFSRILHLHRPNGPPQSRDQEGGDRRTQCLEAQPTGTPCWYPEFSWRASRGPWRTPRRLKQPNQCEI